MKSTLIGIIATGLAGLVGYGVLYVHDARSDTRYVRQDVYQQSVEQQRIWDLQDKISVIQERAQDRGLTTSEKQRIKDLQQKIEKLRGF
jgi:peptidoglycan hydrolase CwlO-like protein